MQETGNDIIDPAHKDSVLNLADKFYAAKSSDQYDLLVFINNDMIACTSFLGSQESYLQLYSRAFERINHPLKLQKQLISLFKEEDLFKLKYKSVRIAIGDIGSTLVPEELYDEDSSKAILNINHIVNEKDVIQVDTLDLIKARNVYALPKELQALLLNQFENVTLIHASTPLIHSLSGLSLEPALFVHVQKSSIEVIVMEKSNLIFYNHFNYKTPQDFIYHVLYVFEKLELNPENTHLTFMGEINKDSEYFDETYKYVRHVNFSQRPDEMKYSNELDTLALHNYFNLFCINAYH
ncbi:MAG: DUF3822 family protein [Bacteroidetes bacterium]|nr:DUF3822 family protein [Bacteroidota bacterium]